MRNSQETLLTIVEVKYITRKSVFLYLVGCEIETLGGF